MRRVGLRIWGRWEEWEEWDGWDGWDGWVGWVGGRNRGIDLFGELVEALTRAARAERRALPFGANSGICGALGVATVGGLEQDKGGVGLRCRIVFISWRGYVAKVFLGFGVGAGVLRLREGTNEGCEGGFQQ
jgi:hypothetical protein